MKLKIIQIIQSPQLRGVEIFTSRLSNQLLALGHDVLLISLMKGSETLPFHGKAIHLGLTPKSKLVDFTGYRRLAAVIRDFKPDIVQANSGDTLKYAVLSKVFSGWDATLIFRNASMVSSYIRRAVVKMFNQYLYSKVDRVISVSDVTRQDLVGLFPFLSARAMTIPIGIEAISLNKADKLVRRFIHIGGFTFEKDHHRLVKIYQQYVREGGDGELWFAGDGPLRPEIEKLVADLHLGDQVKFLGNVRQPLDVLAGSMALLLSSRIEGLPAVILEAFYCRVPVIAFDVGAVGELVKTNDTGYLVDHNSDQEFISAMHSISTGSADEQLIDRAHKLTINRFTIPAVAAEFEKAYYALRKTERTG